MSAGTNYVQMTARDCGDRVVILCAIDNLSKGASGAAVQNMNVMFSLPEATGCLVDHLVPVKPSRRRYRRSQDSRPRGENRVHWKNVAFWPASYS